MKDIEIIVWEDQYHSDFVNLSIEWLEKYVEVEPADLRMLNNPQGVILQQGGIIFFAKYNDLIVGTVAMIKQSDFIFELAKLAVKEEFKGRKISTLLMDACLVFAEATQINSIILYTNHTLLPAINLYRKYGFVEVALSNNKYEQSDMKMELHIR